MAASWKYFKVSYLSQSVGPAEWTEGIRATDEQLLTALARDHLHVILTLQLSHKHNYF